MSETELEEFIPSNHGFFGRVSGLGNFLFDNLPYNNSLCNKPDNINRVKSKKDVPEINLAHPLMAIHENLHHQKQIFFQTNPQWDNSKCCSMRQDSQSGWNRFHS